MDMLIELNWASGRLLREYTILLDPPGMAVPQTVSPVAVSVPQAKPEQLPAPVAAKPSAEAHNGVSAAPLPEKAAGQAKPQKAPETKQAADKPAQAAGSVRVKKGDSLSKIAGRVRPANVSLEQALVSLFHENPEAFLDNNMNRLKAGGQLKVPSVETMAGVDPQSARREVSLQAADWQAYRAKLAESVAAQPAQEKEAPAKTVVGKITPKVEDRAQPKPEAAQDVLKLSKAAVPPVAAAKPDQAAAQKAAQEKALAEQKARAEQEDRIASEKAAKEAAARAAALEKQIQDMQKLAEMKDKQVAAAPAPSGASKPPAVAAPKVDKAPPLPVEEPQASWYDELLENPLYWIGGLAVVVLGGVLWWMVAGGRLRRKQVADTTTDSLITGGELQSSGAAVGVATGGVVNTGDTSFLTDFSQAGLAEIDTHDVDPIAEADVYMAYGRDAQAEEILKEALKKSPDRHEIRLKLLEIYAARKNVTDFEAVAGELYAALGGQQGAVWDKAVEMGRAIDPHNPLYGGSPEPVRKIESIETAPKPAAVEPVSSFETKAEPEAPETAGAVLEFDSELPELEMDLDLATPDAVSKAEASEPAQAKQDEQTLDFDLSGFDLKISENTPVPEVPAAPTMDFSGLDLDLGDAGAEEEFDEVATKLDLARAYLEMGDKEGAREILQEVINEGSDKQKSDAQGIMASL
jgi:pilus assembly protein FimV